MSTQRHYIPTGANLRGLVIQGTPIWTPVWCDEVGRYEVRFLAKLSYVMSWRSLAVHIEPGFQSDGLSIPRRLWDEFGGPYEGKALLGGLLHDALYASELLSREVADAIFLEVMERFGVSWFQRNAMHLAVRLFGGQVWKAHTPESIAKARKQIWLMQ